MSNSDINNAEISRMLRNQAWERAKGELRSMIWTFRTPSNAEEGQFEHLKRKIELFIADIEYHGLHE